MATKIPKVFIVVLNYNGQDCIKRCLGSVFKVDYPNLEIVVVDNNSTDGSLETAKTFFARATFIKNQENLGVAAGNNVGIRYALEKMANWVVLIDQKVEVESSFLDYLITGNEKEPGFGIISPLVFQGNTKNIMFSGGKIDWWKMKGINETKNLSVINRDSDYICGCSIMIRKDVFSKIGLLDEDFFLFWEDIDFSVRAKKAGFSLAVVPEMRVKYFEKNMENKAQETYWSVISSLIFFEKNASFFQKIWIKLYSFGNVIKNKRDLKEKKEGAFFIAKAYKDFKGYCKNK
jgi:GT2 family glycosyltransferase